MGIGAYRVNIDFWSPSGMSVLQGITEKIGHNAFQVRRRAD